MTLHRWAGRNPHMPTVVTQATITCPECGFVAAETMPTNACVYFYVCTSCSVQLRPLPGDCCVFCSYGDQPCPPKQNGEDR